jgi:thiamine biosynthesis lipoprotein
MLALLLAGCGSGDTPVFTTQFVAFDAAVSLNIVGVPRETAMAAARAAERDLLFLDRALHPWKPGPMLRVNERLASGESFAAPPSLLPLLERSRDLARQSDHLFNPAIGHLLDRWGFHADEPRCRPPPPAAALASLVAAAPLLDDLHVDGLLLQSDNPAVRLDFRAIRTGYAMDVVIAGLRARGIDHAMIHAGGNRRAIGSRAGRPWPAPVQRANGSAVLGVVEIGEDMSLFTSSSHRHNFIHDGILYHDVIDPRSGRPATGFKMVAVLKPGDATGAEAAATALMVAGPEGWEAIAERMGLRDVLAVDAADILHMSPGMAARIELLEGHPDVVVSAPLPPSPATAEADSRSLSPD